MRIIFILLMASFASFAQEVQLKDYQWSVSDISSRGISRQNFFDKIDRKFVKIGSSICSNRALMWAWDFKRKHDIDSAKIFLFYTKTTGEVGSKTWWYHVAPMVNEKGNLWVMDPGFPAKIKGPITKEEWLKAFAGSTRCKEIKVGENELIERMFRETAFPETTVYGTYDCYYRITPGTFWTPSTVAEQLLGRDERGRPVRTERQDFIVNELYQACVEATTSKITRALGGGVKECKELLGIASLDE